MTPEEMKRSVWVSGQLLDQMNKQAEREKLAAEVVRQLSSSPPENTETELTAEEILNKIKKP